MFNHAAASGSQITSTSPTRAAVTIPVVLFAAMLLFGLLVLLR